MKNRDIYGGPIPTRGEKVLRGLASILETASFSMFVVMIIAIFVGIFKSDYNGVALRVMGGAWGLAFVLGGISVILKKDITTGFSEDEPRRRYLGKDAAGIGWGLIVVGLIILLVFLLLFPAQG